MPLKEDWSEHFQTEVAPYAPNAWVDTSYVDPTDGEVGKVGYEVNFNRYFYEYVLPVSVRPAPFGKTGCW